MNSKSCSAAKWRATLLLFICVSQLLQHPHNLLLLVTRHGLLPSSESFLFCRRDSFADAFVSCCWITSQQIQGVSLMYKDRGTCCRNIIYILAPTLFDPYVTLLCIWYYVPALLLDALFISRWYVERHVFALSGNSWNSLPFCSSTLYPLYSWLMYVLVLFFAGESFVCGVLLLISR